MVAGTILSVDVGSGGGIYGAGGDGGQGFVCSEDAPSGGGGNGKSGTSALGVEYTAQQLIYTLGEQYNAVLVAVAVPAVG